MTEFTLNNCIFDGCIPLDKEGNLNESLNGEYGFAVFYTIAEDNPSFNRTLEFHVNEYGEVNGDVLLWTSVYEEDSMIASDFIIYNGDVSELVTDFNNREWEREDR